MANNEGTPLHGDRSVWNTDNFASEHAKDIYDALYKHHVPEQGGEDHILVSDGSKWVSQLLDTVIQELAGSAVIVEYQIPLSALAVGSTPPDQTEIGDYSGYSYDIGDDSVFNFVIPSGWDTQTDINVVIYWCINQARTGSNEEVQWEVDWSATPSDESEAVDSPTHSGTIDSGDILIPSSAKYLKKSVLGSISASSLSDGDIIGFTLSRVALDSGVGPTADPVIIAVIIKIRESSGGEPIDALRGGIDAQSSVTGMLSVGYPMTVSVSGQSSISGGIRLIEYLAGSIDATSAVTGDLTVTP